MEFIVTCIPGVAHWLKEELLGLGLEVSDAGGAAVLLHGRLEQALRVCLWSRLAERVLVPVAGVDKGGHEAPGALAEALDWDAHLAPETPLHLHVEHRGVGGDSRVSVGGFLRGAPRRLPLSRSAAGALNLRLEIGADDARAFVDLAGEPLHRRGYRQRGGEAPLRESLAAAMLRAAGWPGEDASALVDPFCGSGTLLIEAALMARGVPAAAARREFGFLHWRGCPSALASRLMEEAAAFRPEPIAELSLKGFDADAEVLRTARHNARAAGVEDCIHFERRELGLLRPRDFPADGRVVTNPPWGERLGSADSAAWLHAALGRRSAELAPSWPVVILGAQVEVMDRTGMQLDQQWAVQNGAMRCYIRRLLPAKRVPATPLTVGEPAFEVEEEARPLLNRLRKNGRQLRRWLERDDIQAYRLYDRELPEFNFSVDIYGANVLLQEYKAPETVDPEAAARRRGLAISAARAVLGAHREQVFLRTRAPQKGKSQYRKREQRPRYETVREGAAWLLVNLNQYLDTGLFLDHRPMRLRLGEEATGKRFLNLFGYTGAATVQAALGGAAKSVTVDSSRRYLEWAESNLALNGFSTARHRLVRSDTLGWLEKTGEQFDLIFCDPPTFSNSKDRGDFSVQRDHAELIRLAMKRLEPGGVLYFSCNFSKFRMDESVGRWYRVEDISRWSIPQDFQRNTRVHYCFAIRHGEEIDEG